VLIEGKESAAVATRPGSVRVCAFRCNSCVFRNTFQSAAKGWPGLTRTISVNAEAVARELPHRERVLLINHRLARRILDAHAAWLDEAEAELRGAAARRR
jgi:hypothetical protein